MTYELEGDLSLEHAHRRRWVSIIAVVIPVAAFVLVSAWFVRVYVVPPTVSIPSPMMLMAAAPPPPPAIPKRAQVEAPPPPMAVAEAPQAKVPEKTDKAVMASALPMFATLAVAPPMPNTSPAYADPAQDTPQMASPMVMAPPPAELASSEPISGVVPLPRAKPHGPVAAIGTAVPLPRPRPAEAAPADPDQPATDRHSVN